MGLNSTFFISLSRMSGLAALISIFRLAVGVQGSARAVGLMGVMWARSGVAPFLFSPEAGAVDSADFSGVDLLLSVQMFSCDGDNCCLLLQMFSYGFKDLKLTILCHSIPAAGFYLEVCW